jgi:hypothetical protein
MFLSYQYLSCTQKYLFSINPPLQPLPLLSHFDTDRKRQEEKSNFSITNATKIVRLSFNLTKAIREHPL